MYTFRNNTSGATKRVGEAAKRLRLLAYCGLALLGSLLADAHAQQGATTPNKTCSVGDKIPADEKAKVQSGIDKLKEVLKGDDTDAIKSATEELTQMFYQMSEKLYQQANPQGGAQAGPDMGGQNGGAQTGPNGQQYYDADYKVVDDDENNKK